MHSKRVEAGDHGGARRRPSTSLPPFLNQQFIDGVKVDGEGINGTNQVASTLSIGAALILGARNSAVDIGLTDNAPDDAVHRALLIRFDVPLPSR